MGKPMNGSSRGCGRSSRSSRCSSWRPRRWPATGTSTCRRRGARARSRCSTSDLAYLDFGGSHAETLAHLRENGRITLMWCAFTGPPKVLRIHGRGEPVFRDDPRLAELIGHFAGGRRAGCPRDHPGSADLVSDSCGFAVPFMDYREERAQHAEYFGRKSERGVRRVLRAKPHNGPASTGCRRSRSPCRAGGPERRPGRRDKRFDSRNAIVQRSVLVSERTSPMPESRPDWRHVAPRVRPASSASAVTVEAG